jgi:RNA polymerase sigma-70 factor (ECF subfamily)
MLQVVFLEAWRRRDKALPPGTVLPWLYGIATNVLHNQRRSERRYALALNRLPSAPAEPDFADSAAEHLDYERQARAALSRLQTLPKREQDVFGLYVGMELTYEEVAFALGIPVGTVRSRLSSARRRLGELDSDAGHKHDDATIAQEAPQP